MSQAKDAPRPAEDAPSPTENAPSPAENAPSPTENAPSPAENAPSARTLRAAFDGATAYTVGIEDEVMLLDPQTRAPAPRAPEVLELLSGDERFKLELPSHQLEIITPPLATVPEGATHLLRARTDLVARLSGMAGLASAGVHPSAPALGQLNDLPRYQHTIREYGLVAQTQVVSALQVHVALGDADRALAVYNAARGYLPLLAALAANAPFYQGHDSGLASVRPMICELLPRQGVPPRIESWEQLADDIRWGEASGTFQPGAWWWELRPHRHHGTLEFRVPDGQSSVGDAAAIAAVVQALTAWLADRDATGHPPENALEWRIAENRWSAARHGVDGHMADLATGELRPTRTRIAELLDALKPYADRLGSVAHLRHAQELAERNGAILQREVAARRGMPGLLRWLEERFLEPLPG